MVNDAQSVSLLFLCPLEHVCCFEGSRCRSILRRERTGNWESISGKAQEGQEVRREEKLEIDARMDQELYIKKNQLF